MGLMVWDLKAYMKRCPECSRSATDDALVYCRFDGARLISDSDSFSNSRTVALSLDKAAAATLAIDDNLSAPASATRTINLPIVTTLTSKLLKRYKRAIRLTGIAVFSVMLGIAAYNYYSPSRENSAAIQSLAVLPFINVNSDQQLDYLSDGMTEMLICNLSRLPILNVKARSSVFRYKGKDISPRAVGAELGVQAILNGRIVSRGDVLTLSLELADARTENIIWSEQYNRKQTDLVSLQNEVALDVFNKLRMKLAGADAQKLSKKYTTNEEAYRLYLKGRLYWNKRTLKDLDQALEYFNDAIRADPNYPLAYSGVADTHVLLPFYRDDLAHDAMSRAREAAMKAVALDSDLAEAHATLGFVSTHEYDFVGAEREYRRALQLDPNYATAHQWYGEMLSHSARHEESIAQLRCALSIDPFSLIINVWYGNSLYYARRYNDAIAQLKKTLELDDRFALTHQSLANVYQATGNYTEAVEEFAKYQELIGELQTAAQIRKSFAAAGWTGFLRAMTGESRPANVSRYERVGFLAALGEKDKAFAEPDEAYQVFGCVLKVDPLLDNLRRDSRFGELLRRIGLP